MAFVLAIISILATASFWWWRMKAIRNAASDVVDLAGRVKGEYKRKKFRRAAASSPITAINDPVIAAATLLCEIATTDIPNIGAQEQVIIRQQICQITDEKSADEAVIYGAWAVRSVSDLSLVILRLGGFLRDRLNQEEKEQLIEMIVAARRDIIAQLPIQVDAAAFERALQQLKKRLGLEVNI